MTGPLPGEKIAYSSWTEQVDGLRKITGGLKRVAMQYSPNCAIPYVSMVDAGTVELVRSVGLEVVSSAELIQAFEARWTPEQLESHLEAGRRVDRVRAGGFRVCPRATAQRRAAHRDGREAVRARRLRQGGPGDGSRADRRRECQRVEPALRADRRESRADPQGRPGAAGSLGEARPARMPCTTTSPGRTSCGDNPPDEMRKVFEVVTGARDAAVKRVKDAIGRRRGAVRLPGGRRGARRDSGAAAMANISRTARATPSAWRCTATAPTWTTWRRTTSAASRRGRVSRSSRACTCPTFGIRSEVNMFVGDGEARVTGEIQRELALR